MTAKRILFERILCPTDLSPESDKALRYGAALALAYEATLYVCHCLGSGEKVTPDLLARLIESAVSRYLHAGHASKLKWEPAIVEGDPAQAIVGEAADRRVDLIVMRSRRRPYAAALLGSTAEAICRTAPCPVLVTHEQEREWAGSSTSDVDLKRVLVAHDFSSDSELALSYALSMAEEYQAELHLLHVLQPAPWPGVQPSPWPAENRDEAFEETARLLKNSVPADVHLWCKVKQVVRRGQPYREILDYAEEHEIDLICMGVHGTGFGMRALFGSNVDRVLRQAPCPTLIARPLRPVTRAGQANTSPAKPEWSPR